MVMLQKIGIHGFKSINSLDLFELKSKNIFIGSNGAGKSNLINFFKLLRLATAYLASNQQESKLQTLNEYVRQEGGSEAFLFNGSKVTQKISCGIATEYAHSSFYFQPTVAESFDVLRSVDTLFIHAEHEGKDSSECYFKNFERLSNSISVYHFHDTSKFSPLRKSEYILDNAYLRSDGANLAPYLYMLKDKHPKAYTKILNTIRMVAPFFDDFLFTSSIPDKVWLSWKQKGSDYPLMPYHFSDGTLRFIALTTALLQPNPPALILIDEPELGLHPDAITLLAEMIQSASLKTQILVSTQSPALVDCFAPEEVVVVGRENGASTFTRLDSEQLKSWLTEYSLGELWRRNIIAGSPSYE